MTEQLQEHKPITLAGSAQLIREYLGHAFHNIIYKREICSSQYFKTIDAHGLRLMSCTNPGMADHIDKCLDDIENIISENKLHQVTFAIFDNETDALLEKWEFKIENEIEKHAEQNNNQSSRSDNKTKDINIIQGEICAVLRQIIGSIQFLPLIKPLCKPHIVIHHSLPYDHELSSNWRSSTRSLYIDNSETFQYRSFSTSLHKMNTQVIYKT